MDIRDLSYFLAIAEEASFARAADRVKRSQPALTKCIKRLEDSVGAKLFRRVGRSVVLTEIGETLRTRAKILKSSFDDVQRELAHLSQGLVGHVRIGTGATTAEYLLPTVCQQLLRQAPSISLEIKIGMNDVLRTALRADQLDMVVGPVTESDRSEFSVQEFGEDWVVVAASRDHPVCRIREPAPAALAGYGWVLPAETVATRQWINRAFELAQLPPPKPQIETNSISLMPQLIAKTQLLSFISRRNLGDDKIGKVLSEIPIRSLTMRRRLGVVYNRHAYLSPAARRFLDLLRANSTAVLKAS